MGSFDRPREVVAERLTARGGAGHVAALAGLLRRQHYLVEELGDLTLWVAAGPQSRGVTVEARQRADDGDRWWLSWGGTVWLCAADRSGEALVQIKSALRRVGS